MSLEKEFETYQSKLNELIEHEGKYILIKGDEIIGIYSSYDDAVEQGFQRFKLESFLVKQISTIEQMHFISRLVEPCLTSHAK